jgi:hypothetical protein
MMNTMTRRILATLVLGAGLAASSPAAFAKDPAAPGRVDGFVTIRAHSADVGVGYTWGDGILTFHGRHYPFTVKGVDVAAVGYSTVVGRGRVYNLHRLSDFTGTYAASTGEATLVNGLGGQILVNGTGVQLRIDDITKGARLSGSADGIQLTLK